jgi:uncharacterized protein
VSTPVTSAGPARLASRKITPDLSRGLLLALIAVANAHLYLVDRPIGYRGYPTGLSGVDAVLAVVQMVLVDGRVFPLFAAMVGFGLTRMARRSPVSVIRRRGLVLLGIGAVHGLLLFSGDIVGTYGMVILLLSPLVVRYGWDAVSTRRLLTVAGVIGLVGVLLGAPGGWPQGVVSEPSIAAPTVGGFLLLHVPEWLGGLLAGIPVTAPAVLVGLVIARTGVLDDPAAHRRRLASWAVGGLGAGVVLGLPLALATVGVWTPGLATGAAVGMLHAASGYAGALGLIGLMGLLGAVSWPGRDLVAAAGTWSMTMYLSQSVVFVAVFAVAFGGLGATASLTTATVIGLATWLVTVIVAGLLARAGHRGPFEVLVRRLTYPRPRAD